MHQDNGPDVQLRVEGDEFYTRYETLDGYAAVYDDVLGVYTYAILRHGRFASSGDPITNSPPAGLELHLQEDRAVRADKFDQRFRLMRPQAVADTPIPEVYGPNKGLLEGRQLSRSDKPVVGLTILVNFADVKTSVTPDAVAALFNGENYRENGNYCSVREYFLQMSSGMLDYRNVVVGPVTLSQKKSYYKNNRFMPEALDLVVDMGIDFAQFDSKNDKILDAVNFLYAGRPDPATWLWPHSFHLDWSHGAYRTEFYQISPLGDTPDQMVIGTICHESAHMLCRFPDLYDYGDRDKDTGPSYGMGDYCLMSYGNMADKGRTPIPICAYLRYLAGWCPNEVDLRPGGVFQAAHGDYDTVFKYGAPHENEYFLIENRSRLGLDAHLPDGGIAVYHCDINGSNEYQERSSARHYQCALLQADGRFELEEYHNRGGAGDLFSLAEGDVAGADTTPSTRLWNGEDSGLRIADVSAAGATISFRVSG